jgi:hypothetical protein
VSREGRKRWALNERFVIGQPGNPMLERWRLVSTPWFGIYVHFIYREDLDPVPHDHPWTFWSFILRGGYDELYRSEPRVNANDQQRTHDRWSLHHFPLQAAHRIVAVRPRTATLVLVGRKARTWGFYDRFEWIPYQDALGLRPSEGPAQKRPLLADHAEPRQ